MPKVETEYNLIRGKSYQKQNIPNLSQNYVSNSVGKTSKNNRTFIKNYSLKRTKRNVEFNEEQNSQQTDSPIKYHRKIKIIRRRPKAFDITNHSLDNSVIINREIELWDDRRSRVIVTKKRRLNNNAPATTATSNRRRVVVTKKRLLGTVSTSYSNPSDDYFTDTEEIGPSAPLTTETFSTITDNFYYILPESESDSEEQVDLSDTTEDGLKTTEYLPNTSQYSPEIFDYEIVSSDYYLPDTFDYLPESHEYLPETVSSSDDISEHVVNTAHQVISTELSSYSSTSSIDKQHPTKIIDTPIQKSYTQHLPNNSDQSKDIPLYEIYTTLLSETVTNSFIRNKTYTYVVTRVHENEQLITSTTSVKAAVKTEVLTLTHTLTLTKPITFSDGPTLSNTNSEGKFLYLYYK